MTAEEQTGLAEERTELAEERTTLAEHRTTLAIQRNRLAEMGVLLGAAGIGLILARFFDSPYAVWGGVVIILVAIAGIAVTGKHYLDTKYKERQELEEIIRLKKAGHG